MADEKISALPSATTLNVGDEFPINQAGTTRKVTAATIAQQVHAWIPSDDLGGGGTQGTGGAGATGATGPTGLDGVDGRDGRDGATGPSGGVFSSYAILRDEKSSGTNGGTFSSGAWRTHDLNTESADPDGIVSLSSNQFTLGSGTYLIRAEAGDCYQVGNHQIRIRDITNGATVAVGLVGRCVAEEGSKSTLIDEIVVSGSTVFELQHRCSSSSTTFGFGVATGFGEVEVYAEVEILKTA